MPRGVRGLGLGRRCFACRTTPRFYRGEIDSPSLGCDDKADGGLRGMLGGAVVVVQSLRCSSTSRLKLFQASMPTCVGTDLPPSALRGLELDERPEELDDPEDHPERDGEHVHRQHLPSEGAAPAREACRQPVPKHRSQPFCASRISKNFTGSTCSFMPYLGQLALLLRALSPSAATASGQPLTFYSGHVPSLLPLSDGTPPRASSSE